MNQIKKFINNYKTEITLVSAGTIAGACVVFSVQTGIEANKLGRLVQQMGDAITKSGGTLMFENGEIVVLPPAK